MDLNGFDAKEVEPQKVFDLLPPGKYKVVISDSEEKPTKKGDGSYLRLTLTVIDGSHEGRKLFDNLNLNNPNDQAAGIARAALSSICRAVGILTPQASSELHDIPLIAIVKIEPAKGEYEAQNRVKGYESAGVAAPIGKGQSADPAKKPAATEATAAPPWQRKK